MVTDEERREVANWLRLSGESLGFDNCFVKMLCDVAGTDLPTEDFDAAGYLANLIDRPTCQMVECAIDHGSRSWGMRCTACGKELEHMKPSCGWHNCPNCGAEVVAEREQQMSEAPYVAIDPGEEENFMLRPECQECGELIEISFAEFMRCAHDRHRERPACPNCGKRVSIGVGKRLNQETGEWEEVD